jgi:hypothetical protein
LLKATQAGPKCLESNQAMRVQAALGTQIVCSGHGPVVKDAVGKYQV